MCNDSPRFAAPRRRIRAAAWCVRLTVSCLIFGIGCLEFSNDILAQEKKGSSGQSEKTTVDKSAKVPSNSSIRPASTATSSQAASKIDVPVERPLAEKRPPGLPQITTPHRPGEAYELTFDDLKFEMEKGTAFKRDLLTPQIKTYDGAKIQLRGFIKPAFTQTGLTKFIFVRDNQECCFGPTAALYDNVLVKLADGSKTDYTVRPVTIEGRFYLKEYQGPDGNVWSIYRMKDGKVK